MIQFEGNKNCMKLFVSRSNVHCDFFGTGFATPKTPVCEAPLGMQDNKIPDSALSASSTLNSYHTPPANGRLHFQAASKYGGWSGKRQDESPYFQVNFGNWTNVTKVATQGGHDGVWWTKSYSLAYSYDGVFFQDYKEDDIVKVTNSAQNSTNTQIIFFFDISDKRFPSNT